MPDVSVIICTHNPRADYLTRTLNALKAQTLPKEQWELLLIDNASKEPLANSYDLSWHPHARHVREEDLGLTPARLRGIHEAASELLLFVDDDNVLASNYGETLLHLTSEFPHMGCFGAGRLVPEFEEEPEQELLPYTNMLALRSVSERQWSFCPTDHIIPWGAGLAVRRPVAQGFKEAINTNKMRLLLGRNGQQLNSCEDDEFSWVACEMSYGKGIFPELQVTHLIGRKRIQLEYLLRLAEGVAFSHELLKHLHQEFIPKQSNQSPMPRNIIKRLLKATPSKVFGKGRNWWNARRPKEVQIESEIELEFKKARERGIARARETIRNGAWL